MARTASNAKTVAMRFPIRVRLIAPITGFGTRLEAIHTWLGREVGKGRYAVHTSPAIGTDGLGVYFFDLEAAQKFLAAFPDLPLAK